MAVRQDGRIHRAGRGAGNALDLQTPLFEQTIQHAPGERAVSAATLQREVDQNWIAVTLCRCIGRSVGHFAHQGTTEPAWREGA